MEVTQHELPRYKSHKTVWALKIRAIEPYAIPNGPDAWQLFPEESGYEPVVVSNEWKQKHQPQVGGYWVLYKDGYKSYSPAEPFEKVPNPSDHVRANPNHKRP